jgi:hypothetical protein
VGDHSLQDQIWEGVGSYHKWGWIPLLYGGELLSSNSGMSETSAPCTTLSCLIPMADTSHALAELADWLINWFPANNRNFSRTESLVHLFPGCASCLSHHFRDLRDTTRASLRCCRRFRLPKCVFWGPSLGPWAGPEQMLAQAVRRRLNAPPDSKKRDAWIE